MVLRSWHWVPPVCRSLRAGCSDRLLLAAVRLPHVSVSSFMSWAASTSCKSTAEYYSVSQGCTGFYLCAAACARAAATACFLQQSGCPTLVYQASCHGQHQRHARALRSITAFLRDALGSPVCCGLRAGCSDRLLLAAVRLPHVSVSSFMSWAASTSCKSTAQYYSVSQGCTGFTCVLWPARGLQRPPASCSSPAAPR